MLGPSPLATEAGGLLGVQGYPGPHSKFQTKQNKNQRHLGDPSAANTDQIKNVHKAVTEKSCFKDSNLWAGEMA